MGWSVRSVTSGIPRTSGRHWWWRCAMRGSRWGCRRILRGQTTRAPPMSSLATQPTGPAAATAHSDGPSPAADRRAVRPRRAALAHRAHQCALGFGRLGRGLVGGLPRPRGGSHIPAGRSPARLARDAPRPDPVLPLHHGARAGPRAGSAPHLRLFALGGEDGADARYGRRGGVAPAGGCAGRGPRARAHRDTPVAAGGQRETRRADAGGGRALLSLVGGRVGRPARWLPRGLLYRHNRVRTARTPSRHGRRPARILHAARPGRGAGGWSGAGRDHRGGRSRAEAQVRRMARPHRPGAVARAKKTKYAPPAPARGVRGGAAREPVSSRVVLFQTLDPPGQRGENGRGGRACRFSPGSIECGLIP
eukprot:scaffold10972_cov127-Isochrysis_galbana.AAC.6